MIEVILSVILIISLITDIKTRKILNIVTIPTIGFAFIYHVITGGLYGLLFSTSGFLLGLGLLFLPFLLGGVGAGDVKLLAAIGALQGMQFVFYAFIYTALIGGMIAVVLLLKRKDLLHSFKRILYVTKLRTLDSLNKDELHHAFPYGVAIVIGTFITLGAESLWV
ncbi:prepilin peptidase [Virgibacillus sp. MSP4-1]|uniref:A24 family peptidase n=1 Tax=Virgibacillus sp. MSP4-1 TaxID=2700081 RepID=UPI0003A8E06A|nr:prepilin peptidase [Virgibacillus sp. MSP4-1]QHS22505.1 prepilin peptidase [Virgibacillus sp. MSP4-1]